MTILTSASLSNEASKDKSCTENSSSVVQISCNDVDISDYTEQKKDKRNKGVRQDGVRFSSLCRTRKCLICAITCVIITALLLAAAVLTTHIVLTNTHKVLKQYHTDVTDDRNDNITLSRQDMMIYDDDTVEQYISNDDDDAQLWQIIDYRREIVVMKVREGFIDRTNSGVIDRCFATPLNRSTISITPQTIPDQPTQISSRNVESFIYIQYSAMNHPISDLSILGLKGQQLCSGIPVHWVIPTYFRTDMTSSATDQSERSRVKRQEGVWPFPNYDCSYLYCYQVNYPGSTKSYLKCDRMPCQSTQAPPVTVPDPSSTNRTSLRPDITTTTPTTTTTTPTTTTPTTTTPTTTTTTPTTTTPTTTTTTPTTTTPTTTTTTPTTTTPTTTTPTTTTTTPTTTTPTTTTPKTTTPTTTTTTPTTPLTTPTSTRTTPTITTTPKTTPTPTTTAPTTTTTTPIALPTGTTLIVVSPTSRTSTLSNTTPKSSSSSSSSISSTTITLIISSPSSSVTSSHEGLLSNSSPTSQSHGGLPSNSVTSWHTTVTLDAVNTTTIWISSVDQASSSTTNPCIPINQLIALNNNNRQP